MKRKLMSLSCHPYALTRMTMYVGDFASQSKSILDELDRDGVDTKLLRDYLERVYLGDDNLAFDHLMVELRRLAETYD